MWTKYSYNGKAQYLSGWAKDTGIPKTTLERRIRVMGWSLEKALNTPVRGYYTYKGVEMRLSELAKLGGVSNKAMLQRLRRGRSPEEAVDGKNYGGKPRGLCESHTCFDCPYPDCVRDMAYPKTKTAHNYRINDFL